jgi:hypothetical protein
VKFSLKLANGAILDFEGDTEEFERVSQFLAEPPDSLTSEAPLGPDPESLPPATDEPPPTPATLDPETVLHRLEHVGANNDQERVTVIAQLAVESGKEGIDYDTLNRLWTELGMWKPAQFPAKTFANAKSSGLVTPVKPGLWKPTYKGQNFARGLGRGERSTRRSPARPKLANRSKGEESD